VRLGTELALNTSTMERKSKRNNYTKCYSTGWNEYYLTCDNLSRNRLFKHSGLVHSKREKSQSTETNAIINRTIKIIKHYNELKIPTQHRQCLTAYKRRELRSASRLKTAGNKNQERTSLLTSETENLSILHPSIARVKSVEKARFIRRKRVQTPFCRFKEFSKMPTYDIGIPCVRLGSIYKSDNDIEHEEYKESKKRWLTDKGFIPYSSQNEGYEIIKNYVTQDPSEPAILCKFRSTNKTKWIAGHFKLV